MLKQFVKKDCLSWEGSFLEWNNLRSHITWKRGKRSSRNENRNSPAAHGETGCPAAHTCWWGDCNGNIFKLLQPMCPVAYYENYYSREPLLQPEWEQRGELIARLNPVPWPKGIRDEECNGMKNIMEIHLTCWKPWFELHFTGLV